MIGRKRYPRSCSLAWCADTDVIVGLLKVEEEAVSSVKEVQDGGEIVKTTAISAYELLKGSAISSKPNENLTLVGDLLTSLWILLLDRDSSVASNIYGEMKSKGLIIGEFDILIAAIAIQNDETLISKDKHFRIVENLSLKTW